MGNTRAPKVLLAVPLFLTGALAVLLWRWFGVEGRVGPVEAGPEDSAPEPFGGNSPGAAPLRSASGTDVLGNAPLMPPGAVLPSGPEGARTQPPTRPTPPPLSWPPKKGSKGRPSGSSKILLSPKSFTEPAPRDGPVPAKSRSGPAPGGKKAGAGVGTRDSQSVLAGLPKRASSPARLPSIQEVAGLGRHYAEFQDALEAYREGAALSLRQKRILRSAEADSVRDAERIIRQAVAAQPVEDGPPGPLGRGKTWPVQGRVTQEFGPNDFHLNGPQTYKGKHYPHFHTGMDIAAPMGAPIRALDAGRVAHVGHSSGLGMHVILVHAGGLATTYGHMDTGSRGPRVRAGDRVAAGEVIGYIGMTGVTTGPHTHFMAHQGNLINPRRVLP